MKAVVSRLMEFNREIYLKNPERFIAYILWFFMFIIGWLLPFVGSGGINLFGGMAFFSMLLQYNGMSWMRNDERKAKVIPLQSFFGIRAGRLWLSRILSMLRYPAGLMIMVLIQMLIGISIGRIADFLYAEVLIMLAFVLASIFQLVYLLFFRYNE